MFNSEKKSVVHTILCAVDEKHEFEKEFFVEVGTEESHETEMQVYCPFCHTSITVVVKGNVVDDTSVFRAAQ